MAVVEVTVALGMVVVDVLMWTVEVTVMEEMEWRRGVRALSPQNSQHRAPEDSGIFESWSP